MSNSGDEALRKRVDRLAERVRQLEQQDRDASSGREAASGDVERLRRALNGLRREHRDLKGTVEDEVVAYLEEERDVLTRLQERVQEYGEIMREIKRNREHLATVEEDVSDELERLEAAVDGKVDASTFGRRVDEVADGLETTRKRLTERLNKLESRIDFLTADDEE